MKIIAYLLISAISFFVGRVLNAKLTRGLSWYLEYLPYSISLTAFVFAFAKDVNEFSQPNILLMLLLSGVFHVFLVMPFAHIKGWLSSIFGKRGKADNRIRGAALTSADDLRGILRSEKSDLTLAGFKFPARLENLHLLITGATGTGKSVAISEMLDGIAARKDRVFVSDAGGNFLKTYYSESRGDVVLNPLDERARAWSPLAEMRGPWDADLIARSIVPDGDGSSKEWNKYAQTVTAAILQYCYNNNLSNAEIFRLAIVSDLQELQKVFAGTAAQGLVSDENARMFASVRGIVSTYLAPFQYLHADAGRDAFSLRSFCENDQNRGWLFYNFRDDQLSTLAPLVACACDIVSKAILSLEANESRKFWLILDEFASLGRVSSILDYLTKARKAGGRAIIGIQSVAQLRSAYGRDDAQTLLSCLSSQLVLRCPDPETADLMSRMLGDHQISRIIQSGGTSDSGSHDNWSQQITTERVVLPSELQNLPVLVGYLNFAGEIPTAPARLQPRERRAVAKTFVAREFKPQPIPQPVTQPAEPRQMTPETEKTAAVDFG